MKDFDYDEISKEMNNRIGKSSIEFPAVKEKDPIDWPFPANYKDSRRWSKWQNFCCSLASWNSIKFLKYFANVRTHNLDTLCEYVCYRKEGQPLLTACNHHSCLDDPLLWGTFIDRCMQMKPGPYPDHVRYSFAAEEIAFPQKCVNYFVAGGKVIPTRRGDGVYQRGIDFGIEKLNEGEFVHVFPEAMIVLGRHYARLKWGIGRMVMEAERVPIIIPWWHIGMEKVLPPGCVVPKLWENLTIVVGNPIDLSVLLSEEEAKKFRWTTESGERADEVTSIRKLVTDVIQWEMFQLKEKAEALHFEHFGE
eukprot:Nk52_evm49s207 gene=Nk52_evmTU49s207